MKLPILLFAKGVENTLQPIFRDLYQFSTHIPPINLTFHQYLLNAKEPLLVHTGSAQVTAELIPQLTSLLNGQPLSYVFVSHFESDECGGLAMLLEHFTTAKTVCSEVTARQITGFGLAKEVVIKKPGEKLVTGDYELEFIAYPSEMHLWEGLLAFEKQRGVFFSSDLMLSFGEAAGKVSDSVWSAEIDNIKPEQVPDPERRQMLKQVLGQIAPNFIATGHGQCLKV